MLMLKDGHYILSDGWINVVKVAGNKAAFYDYRLDQEREFVVEYGQV